MIPVQSISHEQPVLTASQSSRAHERKKFRSESELVRAALSQSDWLGKEQSDCKGAITELETPSGVVDIVFYRLRSDWRLHAVIGEIPSRWAYAFRQIPYRRIFTTEEFANQTATSYRRAKQAVQEFESLGLCQSSKQPDHWLKIRQPHMALRRLISVEAKLRDWGRALDQAARYLSYSDQSWVLLDERFSAPAVKNVDQFELRNVGLAGLAKSGQIEIHFRPRRSESITDHDHWVVNSEVLKRISGA